MADLGFPRDGSANPGGGGGTNIRFCQISPKTAWNWQNFGPGASPKFYYLDPPLGLNVKECLNYFSNIVTRCIYNTKFRKQYRFVEEVQQLAFNLFSHKVCFFPLYLIQCGTRNFLDINYISYFLSSHQSCSRHWQELTDLSISINEYNLAKICSLT